MLPGIFFSFQLPRRSVGNLELRARGRGVIARVELLDQLERIGPSTTGLHEIMDSLSINQNEWKNRPFLGQVAGLISYYRSVWISAGCL